MKNETNIIVKNHLGRPQMTIKVGMGSEDFITLPTAVWNYGAIVSALIRSRYSQSEVEAIMRNLLGKKMDAADEFETIVINSIMHMQNSSNVSEEEANEKPNEFNEFQEYREKCKARAKELLPISETMGIKEM